MDHGKIVSLDASGQFNEKAVGSKAAGLINLMRNGFPVPSGFCITQNALQEHLEQNNLIADIKTTIKKLKKTKSEDKAALLSDLREAIIEASLQKTTRNQLENHYRKIKADFVVVRSSATAEDLPSHSFAGQYNSYLGIANFEDCVKAVKKCWASLLMLRAYEYRERNGFDHLKISMAVIVQSLVAADTSGVVFTADPISGQSSKMIIEACFGLGEALVSGKVMPDRFIIDKKKLELISRTISFKKIECAIDTNGTTKEQALSDEKSAATTLSKKQIKRLAKLALKVEVDFGCPQDIEWAVRGTDIFFLQSRPITTIPKEKTWQERQVWSNIAAQEVLPDVVTPATLSLIENLSETMFDPVLIAFCMNRGNHPFFDVLAGRVYFNANIWIAVINALPVARDYDFSEDIGSEPGLHEIVEIEKTMTDDDLPDLNFKRFRFYLKIPLLILDSLAATKGKGRSIIDQTKKKNDKWQSLDPAHLSSEQIISNCKGIIEDFRNLCSKSLYLFNVMAAYPALEIVCSKWLPDEQQCAKRLLAGLGTLEDANSGLDLWRLALAASSNPQLRDMILSKDDWQTISRKLHQTKSGIEFLQCWNEFIDRHGYHCRAEIELFNDRWAERPDYILGVIRSYGGAMDKTDPLENHKKLEERRKQLVKKCQKSLRNPFKRMLFNHLLIRAQWGSVFRENIKCEIVRLIAIMRMSLLELGQKLHGESLIKDPQDIFFLKLEEIEAVTLRKAGFGVKETISTRRADYDNWQTITPPGTIVGRYDPKQSAPLPFDADAKVLKGLAVSAGVVTGKARVILRTDVQEQVLPGEILVAPFTDPGWTPYFLTAAAVVMDQGSLLSHGSIVAREYGIPAVVNVGSGTKIIETGQIILVDGNKGEVRLMK